MYGELNAVIDTMRYKNAPYSFSIHFVARAYRIHRWVDGSKSARVHCRAIRVTGQAHAFVNIITQKCCSPKHRLTDPSPSITLSLEVKVNIPGIY